MPHPLTRIPFVVLEGHQKEFLVVIVTESSQNCKWPCLEFFLGNSLLLLVTGVWDKKHLGSSLSVYPLIPTTFTILCVYSNIFFSNWLLVLSFIFQIQGNWKFLFSILSVILEKQMVNVLIWTISAQFPFFWLRNTPPMLLSNSSFWRTQFLSSWFIPLLYYLLSLSPTVKIKVGHTILMQPNLKS